MNSVVCEVGRVESIGVLSRFRTELYACLTPRGDALFELVEAMLCVDGPVYSLPELTLAGVHRRGHGSLYGALASGKTNVARFAAVLAGLQLPRFGGRITLAVDVSAWLRPDAECCDERLFCHVHGRGRGNAQMIPGWPYSFVVALEPGASSFTALLDAVRIGPDHDPTQVTATQIRQVVERLVAAGQHAGGPPIRVVLDSGYDGTRLAWLLADLPVELLVRVRSDRVFHAPAGKRAGERPGRQPRHGPRMKLNDPATWPTPDVDEQVDTARYGAAVIDGYARRHQRVAGDGAWAGHPGEYPVIRRAWEKPTPDPERLTPARVRRSFRRLRPMLPQPARPPKASRPGPGRPKGSKNQRPATRHDVGKRTKTGGQAATAAPPPP